MAQLSSVRIRIVRVIEVRPEHKVKPQKHKCKDELRNSIDCRVLLDLAITVIIGIVYLDETLIEWKRADSEDDYFQ